MAAEDRPLNVLGEPLESCSQDPLTGFYRDGCCRTGRDDAGRHVICARMTPDFLAYSREQGNDLSTPVEAFGFPGLRTGDQWCLCAARWQQAFEAGCAPQVQLRATEASALEICRLEDLKRHAADLN